LGETKNANFNTLGLITGVGVGVGVGLTTGVGVGVGTGLGAQEKRKTRIRAMTPMATKIFLITPPFCFFYTSIGIASTLSKTFKIISQNFFSIKGHCF
jgi:hypothetical protein